MSSPYFLGIPTTWARCDQSGNCHVKGAFYPEGNYQILATDYKTYTLVYACDNWGPLFISSAWILSRT